MELRKSILKYENFYGSREKYQLDYRYLRNTKMHFLTQFNYLVLPNWVVIFLSTYKVFAFLSFSYFLLVVPVVFSVFT